LSWFVQKSHAQTTPIPRDSSGQALKVKPMLGGRLRRKIIHDKVIAKNVNLTGYVDIETV